MPSDKPEPGDKAAWNWGGGAPDGIVAQKKTEGELAITSHRGNTIKKNADPEDPAIELERSGNNVVKKQSELEVKEKQAKPEKAKKGGNSRPSTPASKKKDEKSANGRGKSATPATSKAGSKRKQDEVEKEEDKEEDKEEEEEEEEEKADKKKDEKKEDKEEKKAEKKTEKKQPGKKAATNGATKKDEKKEEKKDEASEGGEKKKAGRPRKDPNAPAAKKQKQAPREGTRRSSRLNK